ncbi:MAG: aspartate aminotransferase family protein [Acidobacteriaceae bacterium]|nr:aspartate aminotransferase family protein [Acidobacteriaceae bacterium]MBV9781751.1 aspartate aminotransferase family protein [Acidobacteriaceae bacterium]
MATTIVPTEAHVTSRFQQIQDLERAYLLQNYARYPLALHRGKGCYVYDTDGKRYLDLISGIGVNSLGHAHPRIMKVIREQAGLLLHTSNLYYHEYQGRLAERLAKVSGLTRTFFCNSGTEAMEGALKMIRAHGNSIRTGKHEIISLENSFHGRTFGALSITGQSKYRNDFEPLLTGIRFVPRNDIEALEAAVSENTAGIVLEFIQGEGGIYSISEPFARKARELADRFNSLFVFDEIQCGVGRPGTYFAYQLLDPVVMPDIALIAKPMACGIPLGAIIANDKAASAIKPGMHGSTYGGGPLAGRVALEFFDILDELLPSINAVGSYFRMRLTELMRKFAFIKEIRGQGLMIGVELTFPCKQLVLDGIAQGILFNCTHDTVLRFLPPYILTEHDVDRAIALLTKILKKIKTTQV